MFINSVPVSELRERRRKLAEEMSPKSVAVVFSNPTNYRQSDIEYPFRQESNFWYLSGWDEPGAVFLMRKESVSEVVQERLLLPLVDRSQAVWVGESGSPEQAKEITGVSEVQEVANLWSEITSYLSRGATVYHNLPADKLPVGSSELMQAVSQKNLSLKPLDQLTQSLRQIKSEWELEQMRAAAKINNQAHQLVWQNLAFLPPSPMDSKNVYEYQLEAELLRFYKNHNLTWSYPPIVASGANATTLHYIRNSAPLEPRSLILMDAGCEYNYYASDVTRTFAASGYMTGVQQEIYELVNQARRRVLEKLQNWGQEDLRVRDLQEIADQVLTQGLFQLGMLHHSWQSEVPRREREIRQFFPHGLGHWLGLDTHDAGDYEAVLRPGMCLTVEPGLYFRESSTKYGQMGVRIEDNVCVTERGIENLNEELTTDPEEVKQWLE